MRYLSKLLGASGLVILTGPLCLLANAQSYIDVEAERAAAAAGSSSVPASSSSTSATGSGTGAAPSAVTDPYAVQPATPYSTSSPSTYSSDSVPPVSAVPTGSAAPGGQNLGNLFLQIQQLQQEVMRLNGKVEEQAHELRMLKEQSLQRYVDLDKRVGAGAAPAASDAPASTPAAPKPAAASAGSSVPEEPGEGDAYRAAFALVTGQEFDRAVTAFQQFLGDYPAGKYAPNAHYWLGELYLVVDPPDLESSRQSFTLLLSEYPETSKAPDAMYKLGKVYFDKGNREKAREYMDRVIRDYGNTNSSAVKLARDFIAANY